MGGAFTKTHDNHVLSLCRKRKRLLKRAVENRDAFAVAQCKYNNSLLMLSKAMRLFVVKHSSQSSQTNDKNSTFLPNKPTNDTVNSCPISEVAEERQKQEEKTQVDWKQKGVVFEQDETEEGDDSEGDEIACREFYDEVVPEMTSMEGETSYEWDFFDPYAQVVGGLCGNSGNMSKVRKPEDIPNSQYGTEVLMRATRFAHMYKSIVDHGESGVSQVRVEIGSDESLGDSSKGLKTKEKPINNSVGGLKIAKDASENLGENKDSKTESQSEVSDDHEVKVEGNDEKVSSDEKKEIETPNTGKDLLKALEEIEGLFRTAYGAGLDVSKMLEATRFQQQTGLTENSNNVFWSIVRNLSSSTRCACWKFFLPPLLPTNNRSPTGAVSTQIVSDEHPGMQSGSHSFSMATLYNWERKLYEDVKMGENYRKLFERECVMLREKEERDGFNFGDKTRLKAKTLQARIWVAVECAQAISSRIVRVRDEEIEPQIFELLGGLMKMWKAISEAHQTQSKILFEVAAFNNSNGRYCTAFHRHAIINLDAELKKWCASFSEYVSAQKTYIESLDAWFSTCNGPEPEKVEEDSEEISSAPQFRIRRPPVISVCRKWLACMAKLPDKAVMSSLIGFGKEIKNLSVQQGKEQKQRKKVEGLFRELDRMVSAIHKEENKILKLKESKREVDGYFLDRVERLKKKKISLEGFKQKIELERVKHISSVEEIQRATLAGFQTGFYAVLESLVDFSGATVKMFNDLSTYIDNAKETVENSGNKQF